MFAGGDGIEQAFEAVERRVFFGIQGFAQVIDGVGNVFDGAGEGGAAGIGMAAALKLLGDLQRFAVPAAEAGDNDAVGAAKER